MLLPISTYVALIGRYNSSSATKEAVDQPGMTVTLIPPTHRSFFCEPKSSSISSRYRVCPTSSHYSNNGSTMAGKISPIANPSCGRRLINDQLPTVLLSHQTCPCPKTTVQQTTSPTPDFQASHSHQHQAPKSTSHLCQVSTSSSSTHAPGLQAKTSQQNGTQSRVLEAARRRRALSVTLRTASKQVAYR